jgi:hypothetical protein
MAKGATDFAQQNTERAMQATTHGMNWMREVAEQNLSQSKAALESRSPGRRRRAWISKRLVFATAPCSLRKKRS